MAGITKLEELADVLKLLSTPTGFTVWFEESMKDFNNLAEATRGEEGIADLNREQLQILSVDSNEAVLFNKAVERTVYGVSRGNQPPGTGRQYWLKDTGEFHKSITAEIAPKPTTALTIFSDDRKLLKIEENFGDAIVGLTDTSIGILRDHLKIDMPKKLRELLRSFL